MINILKQFSIFMDIIDIIMMFCLIKGGLILLALNLVGCKWFLGNAVEYTYGYFKQETSTGGSKEDLSSDINIHCIFDCLSSQGCTSAAVDKKTEMCMALDKQKERRDDLQEWKKMQEKKESK